MVKSSCSCRQLLRRKKIFGQVMVELTLRQGAGKIKAKAHVNYMCWVKGISLSICLQASNKGFLRIFCFVSLRISAYPKWFLPQSLALVRIESSYITRKCFHFKNKPNMGVVIKGKKPDYIFKCPHFRKQVQSIRNSKDESSKYFYFFFSSQHSVQKTKPCSEFSFSCVLWFDVLHSPHHPTSINHPFLSQIPASAILLGLALGHNWAHGMTANGFNRRICLLFRLEKA